MKKKKQKNKISVLFLIFILIIIVYYFSPKEVKFEDISFKEFLKNYSNESIPYELHFSIVNPTFKSVNCIAILSLSKDGEKNETGYNIGKISKRTKLKYKIPFNMPLGNTSIKLDKNCTAI